MNEYLSVAPLNDLVVIDISGADSAGFLQGQLTQDIAGLDGNWARLAGYCTAKGRLLATLVVWGMPDKSGFHALVKADIAQALLKRLSMYVLRAKVTLQITPLPVYGISIQHPAPGRADNTPDGSAVGLGSPAFPIDADRLPAQPTSWTVVTTENGRYIAAPTADPALVRWWFVPADSDQAAWTPASDRQGDDRQAQWQAADIAAGLPWVVAATQDTFIPQTLNLDLIDGVSFSKGCYPGQEVVARSHYRGKVKRRMAYGVVDDGVAQSGQQLPGIDLYDAKRPDNPCGRVVNAALVGRTHLLMEVQLADLDQAQFRLGTAEGPAISVHALPYDITPSD